ncbi:hypothetical protein K2X33_01355 [bacterium]|nr:hypothetical protein [bacterium]
MFWTKFLLGVTFTAALTAPGIAFAASAANKVAVPAAETTPAATAPVAPEASAPVAATATAPAQPAVIPPYRTFVAIQSYIMETNGDASNPISNVRLEVKFPGDKSFQLPDAGQYWPIGNGQTQEINRTFEVPYAAIQKDGFGFVIQMVRKGSKMLPCQFQVTQLSEYNRTYFCHTDVEWQVKQKFTEEKLNKEGIQIRVFTDRNTPSKEIPKDALAVR